MTMLLMTLLSVAASDTINTKAEDTPPPATWAVGLKLSVPAASISLVQGAGLGFLGGYPVPMSGLQVERALGRHFTVELGLAINALQQLSGSTMSSVSLSATPAIHWYPGQVFDGGWVGVGVPLMWSDTQSTFSTDLGPATFTSRTITAGLDLLLGWTFRWGNRFMASLAVGPTIGVAATAINANGAFGSLTHGNLGVEAFFTAGVAF